MDRLVQAKSIGEGCHGCVCKQNWLRKVHDEKYCSKYNKTTLKNLSHKYRMSSHEISAKTGQNVDGMFMSIIE